MDVTEAALLGISCVVIAGTGAGKTLPLVMPLLMDDIYEEEDGAHYFAIKRTRGGTGVSFHSYLILRLISNLCRL
jgi:hypothetical protein